MKYALLILSSLILTSPLIADDWPQWRGPDRTGLSKEVNLLKEWSESGPKVAWEIDNVGIGYSSVVIADGRIYTMGDIEGVEHTMCFSEKDGSLLWARQPGPVEEVLDAKVKEQFDRFDSNKDGKLSEEEAIAGLGARAFASDKKDEGIDVAAIASKRAAVFVKTYDQNSDVQLDAKEMPASLGREVNKIDAATGGRTQSNTIGKARAERTIALLDEDSDGSISQKEARGSLVQSIFNNADKKLDGEKKGDGVLTADELTEYFAKRETGRDGLITVEELTAFFQKNHPGTDGVLDLADLKRSVGGYRNGMGDGPRGTPTVDGDFVFTEGGNGDLTCFDTKTGDTVWHVNLSEDFGGKRPGWGYSESPLVAGNLLLVTPGGKEGTMVALDKKTGKQVWRSSDLTEAAHYSSPVLATVAGKEQVVQFGRESVFGLTLNDGNFLWKYSGAANGTANCSSPVIANDMVLSASAYGTGGGLVKVSADGDAQKAEELWFEKSFQNHHGGFVKVGEHVYGFGANTLICLNFKTGEIAWQEKSVGKGSVVFADGMLYCLGERHEVALVEANSKEYVEKGRFKIEDRGRPSWAHPVVANGKFYIRNQGVLTAYDVAAK